MDILKLIGRSKSLFINDLLRYEPLLQKVVSESTFLVLGGAGSIGQAVTKEIFKRNPLKLFVVDISENNLVELVRDLRSSIGYIKGDFQSFALDVGSWQFDMFLQENKQFDFVLNLTALKHVRSEKDPFTLTRMIETNIINTIKTVNWAKENGVKKYFAVSTDKAANPVNLMGASKRIMEMFLMRESSEISISTARFANVAFSDGSLLHGFEKRFIKNQPIVAPNDVRRYFVTPEESGLICLFSTILGNNMDVFFPKLTPNDLHRFSEIAVRYLKEKEYEPIIVDSEDEARKLIIEFNGINNCKKWPCFFSSSDTTGEKDFEEFFTENEQLDLVTFEDFGVIKSKVDFDTSKLDFFVSQFENFKKSNECNKIKIIEIIKFLLPDFKHEEKGKYLDSKM
ncbi:MAG: UDP-N-acetylglucosamine 4,6-dehydratase [Bacteroidia bacterium]|nr:UDP-N-acetylglucosamine 4,6-dehydratase [Bacteroidia bacterium]